MFIIKSYKVDERVRKQKKLEASQKEVFSTQTTKSSNQNTSKVASKRIDFSNELGDSLENSEDVPIQEKKLK